MASNNCAERTVLLTAFEPFAGDEINPSWEAAHPLNGWRCCNARIQVAKLPCVFGRAVAEMEAAINLYQPSLIIGTGLARDIDDFRLERVAVNIIDATIPDNIGQQPRDQHITQDGAAAYFSSLPLRKIEAALQSDQIPVSISYSAGTYVGNHVFYALMRHLERLGNLDKVPAGFIHLPYLPQQAALMSHRPPSMALEMMIRGLGTTIRTCLKCI
ncbi:pyroglutamyl-peptidase I [Herbaspirillum robiniae]|uniref:Pyrrolidone-carboxylate peptidase n=2 Tax=Herbaspirillum robiniae TaxID=2014887 RepID=A0ABX2M388_9BURK|nr:pyroglutamyl-peptidase I [Herbaspirillum robiniae]